MAGNYFCNICMLSDFTIKVHKLDFYRNEESIRFPTPVSGMGLTQARYMKEQKEGLDNGHCRSGGRQ